MTNTQKSREQRARMREKFQCQDEISVRVFFFDTINANLSDILTYNYSNAIEKTIELIKKNEI